MNEELNEGPSKKMKLHHSSLSNIVLHQTHLHSIFHHFGITNHNYNNKDKDINNGEDIESELAKIDDQLKELDFMKSKFQDVFKVFYYNAIMLIFILIFNNVIF